MRSLKIDLSSMSRVKFVAGATLVASLVAVSAIAPAALAQKKSGSETGLVGITLYDDGVKVISKFGSPDEVVAVSFGGGAGGGGGAGAPGGFGPGSGRTPGGPGGAGAGRMPSAGGGVPRAGGRDDIDYPSMSQNFTGPVDPAFDFANEFLLGQGTATVTPKGGKGMPRPGGPGGGAGGMTPMGPGSGAGPAGPGGKAGPAGGASGTDTRTIYTRWIYKRSGSQYGFVFDKYNRVVQIEAIGIANPKVYTKRGVKFGTQFGPLITKYAKNPDGSTNEPDGYEINGTTVVVRYLVKNKVAFKLSKLGKDKPYVVTGIVIAAGKL